MDLVERDRQVGRNLLAFLFTYLLSKHFRYRLYQRDPLKLPGDGREAGSRDTAKFDASNYAAESQLDSDGSFWNPSEHLLDQSFGIELSLLSFSHTSLPFKKVTIKRTGVATGPTIT